MLDFIMKSKSKNAAINGHDNNTAIELLNVSLRIPVRGNSPKSLKKALLSSLTGGKLVKRKQGSEIYALQNINCSIKKGERVALIGHNGAGKSSFLRLISGIYKATEGSIYKQCKVHPMIQKTFITGPDLSGEQAAKGHFLITNGSLKGFDKYLDEIIEFSELGEFIHMPIKNYSEGMSARLLFTLLTSGSHECLALDEGFGTGDARFFSKAQKRLEKFIAEAGTLILASHSDELLKQFCSRGIIFKQGRIIYDGQINDALSFYHENY